MSGEEQEWEQYQTEDQFNDTFWRCMIIARDWLLGEIPEFVAVYDIECASLGGDLIEWAERVCEYDHEH